jgi:hypothetical protein
MAKIDEFVVESFAPSGHIAYFEQDDATGYLYICESDYKVLHDLHIYNRARGIHLCDKSVKVVWDKTSTRAGVLIGGVLRGVLGLNGDLYRPPMISMESPGVEKPEWTRGFESALTDHNRK